MLGDLTQRALGVEETAGPALDATGTEDAKSLVEAERPVEAERLVEAEHLVEAEVLVEEISIDGMCGVY